MTPHAQCLRARRWRWSARGQANAVVVDEGDGLVDDGGASGALAIKDVGHVMSGHEGKHSHRTLSFSLCEGCGILSCRLVQRMLDARDETGRGDYFR